MGFVMVGMTKPHAALGGGVLTRRPSMIPDVVETTRRFHEDTVMGFIPQWARRAQLAWRYHTASDVVP